MATRTSTKSGAAKESRRDFLFHNQLAEYGPVRLTVDGPVREHKTQSGGTNPVVDITILPKGKAAEPYAYWSPNAACIAVFSAAEVGVPFHVVAEGDKAEATLVNVGQPGGQAPAKKSEATEPPVAATTPAQAARRGPTPHNTATKIGQADKETVAVKIAVAKSLALKTVCTVAMMRFKADAEAAGAPTMPPESFWAQVTNLNISSERLAQTLPVDLTFARLAEMAAHKSAAQVTQEPPPTEPTQAAQPTAAAANEPTTNGAF